MAGGSQQADTREGGTPFGKYRIVREVGDGAFGKVHEAFLPGPMGFAKRVALKMLRPRLLEENPEIIQSLVNEARLGGLLHHANIVDILEFDQVDGQYYLAMEFVDGITLKEIKEVCRKQGVMLPPYAIIDLAIQVCRGLQHAHDLKGRDGCPLNLVHRDLKTSNILVDAGGTAKILDFGIAKAESNLNQTTATAPVKGTPRYMSPEQAEGRKPLSAQSDIFSLGAVLYEMITGRVLIDGDTITAVVHQICYEDLSDRIDEADASLPGSGPILARALHRDLAQRYSRADAMADDLRKLGHSYPAESDLARVLAEVVPAADRTEGTWIQPTPTADHLADQTRPGRSPGMAVAVAVVGLALVAVLAVFLFRDQLFRADTDPAIVPDDAAADIHQAPEPTAAPQEEETPAPEPPTLAVDTGAVEEATPESPKRRPAAAPGTVSVMSVPWADIYVDGDKIKSDVRLKGHPLSGGRHEVRLVCSETGGSRKTFVFDVDGGDVNLGCWNFHTMDSNCEL